MKWQRRRQKGLTQCVCLKSLHEIITSDSPRVGYVAPAEKEEWTVQYIRETAEDERDARGASMFGL